MKPEIVPVSPAGGSDAARCLSSLGVGDVDVEGVLSAGFSTGCSTGFSRDFRRTGVSGAGESVAGASSVSLSVISSAGLAVALSVLVGPGEDILTR